MVSGNKKNHILAVCDTARGARHAAVQHSSVTEQVNPIIANTHISFPQTSVSPIQPQTPVLSLMGHITSKFQPHSLPAEEISVGPCPVPPSCLAGTATLPLKLCSLPVTHSTQSTCAEFGAPENFPKTLKSCSVRSCLQPDKRNHLTGELGRI